MLIQPGESFRKDCRPPRPNSSTPSGAAPPLPRPSTPVALRVVQWNIERGYELPAIVRLLREVNADVVALQEVDVDCERSGSVDTGLVIAEALQLNYLYTCEFLELRSPLRGPRLQGGNRGHHGHALLSKWELRPCPPVEHAHQPVDWAAEGDSRGEPRRGRRLTMKAVVDVGGEGGVPVLVYCGHFEVFAGLLDRLHALADVLQDARDETPQHPTQLLLADCNTSADTSTAGHPPQSHGQCRQRDACKASAPPCLDICTPLSPALLRPLSSVAVWPTASPASVRRTAGTG